jgi:hypothetical protein
VLELSCCYALEGDAHAIRCIYVGFMYELTTSTWRIPECSIMASGKDSSGRLPTGSSALGVAGPLSGYSRAPVSLARMTACGDGPRMAAGCGRRLPLPEKLLCLQPRQKLRDETVGRSAHVNGRLGTTCLRARLEAQQLAAPTMRRAIKPITAPCCSQLQSRT